MRKRCSAAMLIVPTVFLACVAFYSLSTVASLRRAEASSAAHEFHTEENVPVEITFHASRAHSDPFNQLDLDVVFTDPDGLQCRVPAFWDGGSTWKARYASGHAGVHRYRTECSDPSDKGLHGKTGTVVGPQGHSFVLHVKDGDKVKTVICRPEHLRKVN